MAVPSDVLDALQQLDLSGDSVPMDQVLAAASLIAAELAEQRTKELKDEVYALQAENMTLEQEVEDLTDELDKLEELYEGVCDHWGLR